MKKTLLLCTLLCLIILSACKKDQHLKTQLNDQTIETPENLRRTCGMEDYHNRLLEDENYRRNHALKFERIEKMSAEERSALCNTPTILPVAVHYQGVSNPDVACLRALAASQIQILNDDYNGTNDDISNWTNNASNSFPGINNGETCVTFCLASKNHPAGYNLSNGDPAVTINQTNGDQVNDWSGYINIFVRPNLGFLGYSPLGGSGNGDGVVVDAGAFGAGNGCGNVSPQNPYDLGRTLTHELGHYLLLDHIWGGGCGQDDGVNDTPDSNDSYFGCPNIGAATCSSTDMHMNYMDYTNDACMYMFTAGQSTRMENYFASSLQNVINNASNVCEDSSDPTDPTCEDGIQNGQETGVDCGGPDCEPCDQPSSCNDGIQNGQETGVDCGGPDCEPCDQPSSCNDGVQNGQETGVDCGGPDCEPCDQPSSCNDGIQNGQETGVDCGGPDCEPCDGGSDCDGTEVSVELVLDDYGSETTWYLVNDYGDIIDDGGPYEDGQDGTLIEADYCLDDGCYYLVVFDQYGDGICCYYGEGYFQLLDVDGQTIAASDGQFGYFDYLDFCVRGGEVDSWGFRTDPRAAARSNANKRSN